MAKAAKKKVVKGVKPGNKTHKITDEIFWQMLVKNGCYFAQTAEAIEKKYGIKYTRSAVQYRATQNPELLQQLKEAKLDRLEDRLEKFTEMQYIDPAVAFQATKFALQKQGKSRGYGDEKAGVNVNVNKGDDDASDSAVSLTIKIAQ